MRDNDFTLLVRLNYERQLALCCVDLSPTQKSILYMVSSSRFLKGRGTDPCSEQVKETQRRT